MPTAVHCRRHWVLLPLKKIIVVHCRALDNVGDMWSPPTLYFPLPGQVQYRHIRHVMPWDYRHPIVIGGGGLLFFRKRLQRIIERKRVPMLAWGIGHNTHGADTPPDYADAAYLRALDLCGVRDRGVEWPLVPCASCMSPLLDRPWPIRHEMVVYDHARFPVPEVPAGVPRLRNDADLFEVIRFLGSARIVVTTSYHGAYWATLLGRSVVCLPFSSKFHAMPHPPTLASASTWLAAAATARTYPEALSECRAANWAFYLKARALLEG